MTLGFQSTLPVRGATRFAWHNTPAGVFQSTLPVRGATQLVGQRVGRREISIHAPRAGSDPCLPVNMTVPVDFNPRSPCGERPRTLMPLQDNSGFQSTLPVRGATNIRLPILSVLRISIHGPRAGSDPMVMSRPFQLIFQSTLPVRVATYNQLRDLIAL